MSKMIGAALPLSARPASNWAPDFTCGDCPLWDDLRRPWADRRPGVPSRVANMVRPGACRLEPRPVHPVGHAPEPFAIVEAAEPGCARSPLYQAAPARLKAGKSSSEPAAPTARP